MLTGELPGKRLEAPSKKVHIDVRLDEIVLRAMEKNPDLRFQQASVMKTRVDDLGTQLPKPEPPVVKRLSVAKILAIGCGVLALVLIVGLVGLGTVFWYRASELGVGQSGGSGDRAAYERDGGQCRNPRTAGK
jgi:hypothetical protein